MIILRKFLGFVVTTLLIGICLGLLFAITEGASLWAIGLFLTGAFPFVLVIGVPVSFLSDYLARHLQGKRRMIAALLIHGLFGLLAGFVITYFFENENVFLVGVTIVAALIFWFVDEMLRITMK